MRTKRQCQRLRDGSAMILTVFIIALAAAMVIGMLQLNTEQTLQIHNQIELTQAMMVAEAGLNDAFYELRQDSQWNSGFNNKVFLGDRYTVTVNGMVPNLTIVSTGRTSNNYYTRLEAEILVGITAPHSIQIQTLRINE